MQHPVAVFAAQAHPAIALALHLVQQAIVAVANESLQHLHQRFALGWGCAGLDHGGEVHGVFSHAG